jgi:hypothetical protein
VRPPLGLYAFFGLSVVSAALGLWRGYSAANVAKQFFGCLLFAAYFWFALRLTPSLRDIKRVTKIVSVGALVSGLAYVLAYVPLRGVVRDTILNDYTAGIACLLLPQLLSGGTRVRTKALLMTCALLAVPIVDTFKRSVAGFGICALLFFGLRSRSRAGRYAWLAGSFVLFTLFIATPLLDYAGRVVAKEPILSRLIPENTETNYSVYLRLLEAKEKLASSGGVSLLGTGLGSSLSWFNPYSNGWFTEETISLGWAYVLIKLGVLGLAVFVWVVGGPLIKSIRIAPGGAHLALALLVSFFIVEMAGSPVVVYFATAPWVGTACGWLHIFNCEAERGGWVLRSESAESKGN